MSKEVRLMDLLNYCVNVASSLFRIKHLEDKLRASQDFTRLALGHMAEVKATFNYDNLEDDEFFEVRIKVTKSSVEHMNNMESAIKEFNAKLKEMKGFTDD